MNLSDILGLGYCMNSLMGQHVGSTTATSMAQSSYTPLTPSSTSSPISPDTCNLTSPKTSFEAFQVIYN